MELKKECTCMLQSRTGTRKETRIYTLEFIKVQISLPSPSTEGIEVMLDI